MKSINGWTPRRRGEVYCSTLCGGGCTHAEYLAAKRHGRALALELGKGWTWRVWENLGWHYEAIKGEAAVHEHRSVRGKGHRSVTVFFNCTPQVVANGQDANEVVAVAIARAKAISRALAGSIKALE